ncbi:type II toxin-antitoxin system HipA family toxin [Endozoicomonas sp.]|uniref:type II toxin-antitoxin system HipA family toxin n=1 Tax=Endozoicomonas sp. TaxID=1892382 RepID=UPI00383A1055
MNDEQVHTLEVCRTLSDGSSVTVGNLAQNRQGVYFQYREGYLDRYNNLSPFNLSFDASLQLAPKTPHNGLHGAFSDSLPDGWGLLLMDRVFRQAGIMPSQITAMDRLSFVGRRGMGALYYQPASGLLHNEQSEQLTVAELGLQAQAVFDGQTSDILQALVNAGSSGGARPKAQLYLKEESVSFCSPIFCSTSRVKGSDAYLVKFTSSQLPLGHQEGLCEATYLSMAAQAGIEVPCWQLVDAPERSGAKQWLALKRFDTVSNSDGSEGRLHLHSASGLLDADYRMPGLDYETLIKVSSMLCKSPAAGQAMFRRMLFNLFALNQDDHSKNWAFLQHDDGQWQLAPFYDVTFSPSPYGEHATAFAGYGKQPGLQTMQKLAGLANFASWKQAQQVVAEVVAAIQSFDDTARELQVDQATRKLISKQLNDVYLENKRLL